MSVNKFQSHVFVLPEDDADRQIANGFVLDPSLLSRQIQVLRAAGGWLRAVERFKSQYIEEMDRNSFTSMVLLIDFDGHQARLDQIKSGIPERLAERVFVLGALTKPEALRQVGLGSYEEIGLAMAKDCREGTDRLWGHELLRHNESELDRLQEKVRPFLFPSN
jgi:hypothetical protein